MFSILTNTIHYPAHVAGMRELRPAETPVSLDGWFQVNHSPGVGEYLKSLFGPEEMKREMAIWREFMDSSDWPPFYDGVLDLIKDFRRAPPSSEEKDDRNFVCVVSHSPKDVIESFYLAKGDGFMPDMIFGWDDDKSKCKPSAYPCLRIMQELGLKPEECLVVDDLSPGLKMACRAGIRSVVAAWGHAGLVEDLVKVGNEDEVEGQLKSGLVDRKPLYKVEELRKIVLDS